MSSDVSRRRQVLSLLGVALAVGLIVSNVNSIYGLLSTVVPIGSAGRVVTINIEVYWESGCVNNVSSIDWGTLDPGDSVAVTIYMKNTGNVPVTLELSMDGWSPLAAEEYISLKWDYSGREIDPDDVVPITLTLRVSPIIDRVSNFSFDIFLTGTEAV